MSNLWIPLRSITRISIGAAGFLVSISGCKQSEQAETPLPLTMDICEQFESGNAAIDEERFDDAFKIFEPHAIAGRAYAQRQLGLLYLWGDLATGADREKARYWLRAAADQNEPEACFRLAEVLREEGNMQDPQLDYHEEVFDLYANAAALGHPDALTKYALAMVLLFSNQEVDVVPIYLLLKLAEARGSDHVGAGLKIIADSVASETQLEAIERAAAERLLSFEPHCVDGSTFFKDRAMMHMCVVHNYMVSMLASQDTSCYRQEFGNSTTLGDILRANEFLAGQHVLLTNSKYVPEPGAKEIDSDSLWQLVRPGDIVSVSDRITHHLMTVFAIRRSEDKILLIDSWPQSVFLLPNRNAAGIEANLIVTGLRLVGGIRKVRLVEITEVEFKNVIVSVGTVTSSPNAFDQFLKSRVRGGQPGT